MSCLCRRLCPSGDTYTEVVHLDGVPASVLWDIVSDIDNIAQHLSVVESYEAISSPSPPSSSAQDNGKKQRNVFVGKRWKETRRVKGQLYTKYSTLTRLEDDANSNERSISIAVSIQNPNTGEIDDIVNTSTLTVLQEEGRGEDEEDDGTTNSPSSHLLLSIAFEWRRPCDYLQIFCCRPCLQRFVRQHMRLELDDYAQAAHRKMNMMKADANANNTATRPQAAA